ncbi:protein kinase family protein [Streptomyces sp. HSW2009]|uniref:protein kinase family protein n=1 Tax=Streptomyces sp. HSW2009 TaxID=3142890 RepID=UPI0032EFE157
MHHSTAAADRHADRLAARLAARRTAAGALAALSDQRLRALLAAAPVPDSGIGGRTAVVEVAGTPVFVKRIPLTERELRPEHAHSTANLFRLPPWYQYGIGSAGFGAWRELAVHTLTTQWVLGGAHPGFPLTYHWRVLPDSPPDGFVDEFGGVDGAVAHWDGSPAVRDRLEAIGASRTSLVLFLEHLPHTLADWLAARRDAAAPGGSPHPWVADALVRGASFLRSRGLVHFDAHFRNVLTDGELLYFADFGLALSSSFELAADETAFLTDHLGYDHYDTLSHLLRYHVLAEPPLGWDYPAFLRAWPTERLRAGLAPADAALVDRFAPAALLMYDFQRDLLTVSKRTPFPAARLRERAPLP